MRISDWSSDVCSSDLLMDWCLTNNEGFFSVAEREGVLIGGMIGACTPHWCSDDLVAYDFGLFVEPERRGGLAAAGLLRGFIRWARDKGAVGITARIQLGRATCRERVGQDG